MKSYYQQLLERGKLEEFTDRMTSTGNIARAAASWGFAGEGFLLERGAEVILEQERQLYLYRRVLEALSAQHPDVFIGPQTGRKKMPIDEFVKEYGEANVVPFRKDP
jgi:hypothetical protein